MPRLKSRQSQIPNGFKFYQPETGWKPPRFASFDQIVQGLITHRKGNKALLEKNHWPTDYETVANEVDAFNARVCMQMGWTQYISEAPGGEPAPAPFLLQPPNQVGKLEALAAGGRVIVEWIASGEEAVPAKQAEERAKVCADCPLNTQGDWTSFFTVPVSEAIRRAMDQRRGWNLSTPLDDKLKVCSACYCPLPLKVHMGIERILSRIHPDILPTLDPKCWILAEKEKLNR